MSGAEAPGAQEVAAGYIDLLAQAECEELIGRVHALRETWERRHPDAPFFTLGTASYLDATGGRLDSYLAKTKQSNQVLQRNFGSLYERLIVELTEHLAAPCGFDENLALPGFHIFQSDPAFASPASRHCDLQYQLLDWSAHDGAEPDVQLSFTLALKLPGAGAGIDLWRIDHRDLAALGPKERKQLLSEHGEPVFHRYQAGRLFMHSGHLVHQISGMPEMEPADERITLQGHGQRTRGGWVLYW